VDKQELIKRLLELPGEIETWERDVIYSQCGILEAKNQLANKETELLLAKDEDGKPIINGKNAEIRNAQLRQMTKEIRNKIVDAENTLIQKKATLNHSLNKFKALRAIARLMGGNDGE